MSTQLTSHGSTQVSNSLPTDAGNRSQSPLPCEDQPPSLYIEDAHLGVRLCHQAILTACDDIDSAWPECGTADVEDACAWMQKALKEHPHDNASEWLSYMPLSIENMRKWFSANPPDRESGYGTSDRGSTPNATVRYEARDSRTPRFTARQLREHNLGIYFNAIFGLEASRDVFDQCNRPLLHGKERPFAEALTKTGKTSRADYAWEIYKNPLFI